MNNQKWMKRIAAVFAAAVLAGAFAGCGGEKKADASAEARAKIGFITACTGPGAAYGTSQKEGIDMALEEINADPATKTKIDLITYDTKLVKTEAINAMKRAVTQDKVLAVIGPMTTGEFFAAGPIAQQAGVTVFGISLTADGVTDVGDYIFRNAVSGRLAIPITVKKAHDKLGFRTAAVMYSHNNDMLVSENKIYQKLLPEMGVDIVATESFADKDTDFSAQLTKIHAANPDVIVIAGFYQEGALIAKKAREMGMDQPIIGNNGFNSPEYIRQAGAPRTARSSPRRGIPTARAKKRRLSGRNSRRNTAMSRISSRRRPMTVSTPSTRRWISPAPRRTGRNSAIPWRR